MKNFVVFGVVAICTILMASESTMAVVGGGGGGKNTAKARFIFYNITNDATIAVWVRAPGTPLPATLGGLRNQLIFVDAGDSNQTAELKKGDWDIAYGDASDFPDLDDDFPIDEDLIGPLLIEDFTATLNGVDVEIDLPRGG